MKSSQEFIHWLEQGRGGRWLRRAAVIVAALLLTTIYAWKQFHGIPSEFVMQQAVLGRQLAQGKGFTTLVNYPQTYAVLQARGQPTALVMLSAGPGEGKSTTLRQMALCMAAAGEKVLLLDSDVRRPTQHRLADLPREPGLTDVLLNKTTVAQAITRDSSGLFDFLPAGAAANQVTLGLLYVGKLRELVGEFKQRYDKILFDAPPIIGVSDAAVLVSISDQVILLIQHRRNPESMVQRARQIIEGLRVPIIGVVLNQVPTGTGEDYGYYTNNYSYYAHDPAADKLAESGARGKKSDRLDWAEPSRRKKS
ncbi:MAG: tyrosine-protein kinase family protein [Lacunisphaera sp.]|nr:tyrosine-protein kinase family protein [Lacunisphaera sp.]